MANLSLDDRLTPSEHVVVRELGGEIVMLDMQRGMYFGLNGVGTRAWTVFAAGGSLRDAKDALLAEYDAPPSVVQPELLRFAAELCEHGLCHVAEAR